MPRKLKVQVTDKGAVYVNETRITGRSTKWGVHHIVFSAEAAPKDVVETLKQNGYGHIKLDPGYAAEFKIKV